MPTGVVDKTTLTSTNGVLPICQKAKSLGGAASSAPPIATSLFIGLLSLCLSPILFISICLGEIFVHMATGSRLPLYRVSFFNIFGMWRAARFSQSRKCAMAQKGLNNTMYQRNTCMQGNFHPILNTDPSAIKVLFLHNFRRKLIFFTPHIIHAILTGL